MAKLLLVEDDVALAERIRDWLASKNLTVETATDGISALGFITQYEYDVIVLDWTLPGMSGLELCKRLRSMKRETPILILTAKGEVRDKEIGFSAGADDYLTKPFALEELSLRLIALLRRPRHSGVTVLRAANLELELETRTVSVNGNEVKLRPLEFALLEFFMRNPGIVFSAEALLDRVWASEAEPSIESVRTYIKTLRKKIVSEEHPCLIQTIYGLGYRFLA